jgi:drug/metabolite transporter (DMT)-like permease
MSWVLLAILSAVFLGIYDLVKKSAVRDNAVLPVLFFSVVTGAAVWLPFLMWSIWSADTVPEFAASVSHISAQQHFWLFLKSCISAASWIFGYFALKHLPISVAGPIRSTSPVWTILIAVLFLGESPAFWQWAGVLIILAAFYAFSLVGKLEGIHFHRDKWVGFMFLSALLSSASALYDKQLLQKLAFPAATVQCWFSIYLVVVLAPFYVLWKKGVWPTNRFEWRWSIPLIGLSLLAADYLYFSALNQSDALISVISPLRRASIILTFFGGIILFGEKNWKPKAVCVAVLLIGVLLLYAK